MGNLSGFDANDPENNKSSFDLIPAGEYRVIVTELDIKEKSSGAEQLEGKVQILDGQYQNRNVFVNQNLKKKSGEDNDIGRGFLSSLCRAVNIPNPNDTSDLCNKPVIAKIGIEKGTDGHDDKNNVKSWKPSGPPKANGGSNGFAGRSNGAPRQTANAGAGSGRDPFNRGNFKDEDNSDDIPF